MMLQMLQMCVLTLDLCSDSENWVSDGALHLLSIFKRLFSNRRWLFLLSQCHLSLLREAKPLWFCFLTWFLCKSVWMIAACLIFLRCCAAAAAVVVRSRPINKALWSFISVMCTSAASAPPAQLTGTEKKKKNQKRNRWAVRSFLRIDESCLFFKSLNPVCLCKNIIKKMSDYSGF